MRVFRDNRVIRLEERDGGWAAATVLEGVSARAVAAEGERVLLGTRGGIHGAKRDTRMLAWHPTREGFAYQAAGDGAAVSHDGGLTWQAADRARDLPYCWALAPDPSNPESWYVSAASGPRAAHSGPTANGRLYRWDGAWQRLPLPGDSMPYALAAVDDALLVGTADGRILQSGDNGETWNALAEGIGFVVAMSAAHPRSP